MVKKKMLMDDRTIMLIPVIFSCISLVGMIILAYYFLNMNPMVTDVSDIVEKCLPSSVIIQTSISPGAEMDGKYPEGEEIREAATGIIWSKEKDRLYIVTNNHVVKNATKINIRFGYSKAQGMLIPGETVGRDAASDLAVIAVWKKDIPDDIYDGLKPAVLGASETVKVGQGAILIGNALGEGINVSCGIVSAVNRRHDGDEFHLEVMVSDASINFGNSGSMLVNKKGEVIGVNTSKDAKDSSEGMGYYIPVDTAVNVVDKIIKDNS